MARHEVLRTTFVTVAGEPQQIISPAHQQGFDLLVIGSEDAAAGTAGRGSDAPVAAVGQHTFRSCPRLVPLRGALLRLGEAQQILCLVMHHIVSDGWSMGILMRELTALYAAACQGRSADLSPLPLQYADYAVWQRQALAADSPRTRQQLAYWQQQLAGAPALLELPTDRASVPPLPSHAGALLRKELGRTLTHRLEAGAAS